MLINQPTITTNGGMRATWAEINLTRLSQNFQAIRARVAPASVMLVLKTNAYGHGMTEVARHLAVQADYLGVAVLEEGILLRELGITRPILVLGGIWSNQIPQYIEHNLTLTASSIERLEQIDAASGQMGVKAKVHLKIDTGMERIGVHYYSAHTLQEATLKCCRNMEVEGIYSHFASADSADLTFARLQLERFNEVLRFYEKHGLPAPLRHIANSGAVLQLPEANLDMVRPGILMYGVYPSPEVPHTVQVRPALAWKSRVVFFQGGQARASGQLWLDLAKRPHGARRDGAGRLRGWLLPQHVEQGPGHHSRSEISAGGAGVHGSDHGQSRMGHGLQRRRSDVDWRIGRNASRSRIWLSGWDDPLRNFD